MVLKPNNIPEEVDIPEQKPSIVPDQNKMQNLPTPQQQTSNRFLSEISSGRYTPNATPQLDKAAGTTPSYWADPRRIVRYYTAIQSLPANADIPSWLDPAGLDIAYKYLKNTRKGDWTTWENVSADDPLNVIIGEMQPPPPIFMPTWEQEKLKNEYDFNKPIADTKEPAPGTDLMSGLAPEEWDALPGWQKMLINGMPVIQSAIPAIGGGIMGFKAFGLGGAIVGAAGMGLMADYAGKNPDSNIAKIFAKLNVPAEKAEQGIGLLAQIMYAIEDPKRYGDLGEIFKDLDAASAAGKILYESSFSTFEPTGAEQEKDILETLDLIKKYGLKEATGILSSEKEYKKTYYKKWTLGKPEPEIIELPEGMDASGYAMREMRRMINIGFSADQAYAAIAPTFGDLANIRELVGNMLIDPLDLMADHAPSAIGIGSEIVGTPGARRLADAMFQAGDITEGIRNYGVLLRQMPAADVSSLNAVNKWIGGFDQAGNLKSLSNAPRKNIFDHMLGLTPKARATEVLGNYVNGMATLIHSESNPDNVMKMVNSIARMLPEDAVTRADEKFIYMTVGGETVKTEIPKWFSSAEAQAIPNAIKDAVPLVQELTDQYKMTRPHAQIITMMADQLGKSPESLIKALYEGDTNNAQTLFNTFMLKMDEAARKGDKNAAVRLDLFKNDDGLKAMDGARVKTIGDTFFGEKGAPYNIDVYKLRVMETLADNIDKWSAKWFDVKPSHWALRLSNVVKRAQGALLLGFNPSYLINNALDNIFKLSWDGLLNYDSVVGRKAFMSEFGITPTRYRQGIGAAEMGDVSGALFSELGIKDKRLGEAIRKAAIGDDTIQAVDDWVHKGDKYQIAANLSGSMESWSSEVAMTGALKEYWARAWDAGKGFRKVPAELRMALDAVQPGLAKKVENLIKRGKNRQQIESAIFGNLKTKSIRDVLTPDETATLEKMPGLIEKLDADIRNAKTSEDFRAAINDAKTDAQTKISEMIIENSERIVNDAVLKAQTEGTQGVLDGMDNLAQIRADFWTRHFEFMAQLGEEATNASKHKESWQRQIIWQDGLIKADQDWKNFSNIEASKYLGYFKGLGADEGSPVYNAVLGTYSDTRKLWDNFYRTRREEMNAFHAAADKLYAENNAGKVQELWYTLNQKLNEAYNKAVIDEDTLSLTMDGLFEDQYAAQFADIPTARGEARLWRASIMRERRKMVQAQILWRNGELTPEVLKWGDLLEPEFKAQLVKLSGGKPLYTLSRAQRDKINPEFYKLYTKFIGSQLDASNSNAPGMRRRVVNPIETPDVSTKAPEQSTATVETQPAEGIPVLITQKMKQDLNNLGYTAQDIGAMTPQNAWDIINNGAKKEAIETPVAKVEEQPGFTGIEPKPEDIIAPADGKIESSIWKLIAEKKPDMAGLDEAGNILPDAKLNLIKYVLKYDQKARDMTIGGNRLKFSDLTPEMIDRAITKEADIAAKQMGLPIPEEGAKPLVKNMTEEQLLEELKQARPEWAREIEELSRKKKAGIYDRYTTEEIQSLARTIENNLNSERALLPEPKVGREATHRAIFDTLDDPAQAQAVSKIFDALASYWAKNNPGKTVEDWYETFIMNRGGTDVSAGGEGLAQQAKGFTRWLEDGRAILHAFESADVSTMVHEVIHVFTPQMTKENAAVATNWLRTEHKLDLPDDWYMNPVDHVNASELLARGFERYLAEGRSPIKGLEKVFADFKAWMLNIYKQISGSDIDVKLSDDVRKMFDEWMGAEKAGQAAAKITPPPVSLPDGYVVQPGKFNTSNKYGVFTDNDKLISSYYDTPEAAIAGFFNETKHTIELATNNINRLRVIERAIKDIESITEQEAIQLFRRTEIMLKDAAAWLRLESGNVNKNGKLKEANDFLRPALKGKGKINSNGNTVYNYKDILKAAVEYPDLKTGVQNNIKVETDYVARMNERLIIKQQPATTTPKPVNTLWDAPKNEPSLFGDQDAGWNLIQEKATLQKFKPKDEGLQDSLFQTAPNTKRVADMTIEELRHAIMHDELTDMKNRRAYDEDPQLPAQMVLDLEGLKFVNDTFGHNYGDNVVLATADVLREFVGDNAYRGSNRGDEFILQFNSLEEAKRVGEQIKAALKERVFDIAGEEYKGIGMDYGIGETLLEADTNLTKKAQSSRMEGKRANRGERPLNLQNVDPKRTYALSPDAKREYEFVYKIVPLEELIVSHTDGGNPNPKYLKELQPRLRDRAASEDQIQTIINIFNPTAMVDEFHSIDRGTPIIGPDMMVESGNGRTIALQRIKRDSPEKWAAYQDALNAKAKELGLSAEGITDGVLVRERLTDVDRAQFALESSLGSSMRLSDFEQALIDAKNIDPLILSKLNVAEGESIENALRKQSNVDFSKLFIEGLPKSEHGAMMDANGELSLSGMRRIKNAIFGVVYPGEVGERLVRTFTDSLDSSVKSIQNVLYSTIAEVASLEGSIRSGRLPAEFSITDDISKAVDVYARLKQIRLSVSDYIAQQTLFEKELTDFQESLLVYIDNTAKKPTALRDLIRGYVQEAIKQPPADQMDMFGGRVSKGEILDAVAKRIGQETDFTEATGTAPQVAPIETGSIGLEEPTTQTAAEPEPNRGQTEPVTEPAPEPVTMPTAPAQGAPMGVSEQLANPPTEEMIFEGWINTIAPLLDSLQSKLESDSTPSADSIADLLKPEQLKELRKYLGGVYSDMADTKIGAIRHAESRRDFSLLNYSKRYGFDDGIGMIMPYQFWMGRSAANWLSRIAANPAILRRYMKLKNYGQNAEEREGFPRRLQGKIRIPMAFLPDSMGDSVYIDPYKQIFSFEQMTRPFTQMADENNTVNRRAESILQERIANEELTEEEAIAAINDKTSKLWQDALTEAKASQDLEFNNPFDFAWAISSPSLPISLAYQFSSLGNKNRISQTPLARTIQNVTAAAGIGGARGINIEAPLRKLFGLPEIDRFEDYRVNRELSNMVAEGLVEPDAAITAMIDKSGEDYTNAQRRVSAQGLAKQIGSSIGLDFFPEGEQEQRRLSILYGQAIDQWAAGDKKALVDFYDQHPEYEARAVSLAQNPEEQLRLFLRSKVWDGWNKLASTEKQNAVNIFGDVFETNFLNKETRSYDSIPTNTLTLWARSLGETLPQAAPETSPLTGINVKPEIKTLLNQYDQEKNNKFPGIDNILNDYYAEDENNRALIQRNTPQIDQYYTWRNTFIASHPAVAPYLTSESSNLYGLPAEVQSAVYSYRAQVDEFFPNIYETQTGYFNITSSSQKKTYLKNHPELTEYWDWRRQFAAANPKASPYILSDESMAKAILGDDYVSTNTNSPYPNPQQFDESLLRLLASYFYNGKQLSSGAKASLNKLWEQAGKPAGSMENWVNAYVLPMVK